MGVYYDSPQGQEAWIRDTTDEELLLIARELEYRAEQFNAKTRQIVNDELRRRRMPVLGFGTSRF